MKSFSPITLLFASLFTSTLMAYNSETIPVWIEMQLDYNPESGPASMSAELDGEEITISGTAALTTDAHMLFLGRRYSLKVWGGGSTFWSAYAKLKIPQGYYLKRLPLGDWATGTDHKIVIDYPVDEDHAAEGEFYILPRESYGIELGVAEHSHSPYPHEIAWKFGLGTQITGQSSGVLQWLRDIDVTSSSLSDDIYALSNLEYPNLQSPEIEVIVEQDSNGDDYPYQIKTNSVFVETKVLPAGTGFTVDYYRPWDFSSTVNGSGYFDKDPGAVPFCFYRIEKISSTKFRVVRKYGDDTTPLVYEISRETSPTASWKLKTGEGNSSYAITSTISDNIVTWSGTGTIIESLSVKNSSGTVIQQSSRTTDPSQIYATLTGQSFGSGSGTKTTTFTYGGDGKYIQYIEQPGGGWQGINYNGSIEVTEVFEPFKNDPATPTVTESGFPGRLTEIQYATSTSKDGYVVTNNAAKSGWRPAIIEQTVGTSRIPIGKTVNKYTFSAAPSATGSQDLITVETLSFSDSTKSLTSTVSSFAWDQSDPDDNEFRNLPYYTESPGGAMTYYSYDKGILASSDTNPDPSFTVSGSGTAWRSCVYSGTSLNDNDPDGNEPVVSFTDGGRISGFYLIPKKSTRMTTYREHDETKGDRIIMLTEVFVGGTTFEEVSWKYSSYSENGILKKSEDSYGNIYTAGTIEDGLLEDETDATGVERTFAYDALGRITSVITDGVSGVVDAIIEELDYDAYGRVTQVQKKDGETSSSPDDGTLTSSAAYDISGFKTSETLTCGKTISFTNLLVGSDWREFKEDHGNGRYFTTRRYFDGSIESVSGPGVVDEAYSYFYDGSTGFLTVKVEGPAIGSPTSVKRYREEKFDWLGRIVESKAPSYANNRLGASFAVTQYGYYDQSTDKHNLGQLKEKRILSGSGDSSTDDIVELFEYDALGNLFRKGLDVDADNYGLLVLGSTDRIVDVSNKFFKDTNDVWWKEKCSLIYPIDDSTTQVFVSRERERLTGYSTANNVRLEKRIWNPHDSSSDPYASKIVVEINRAAKETKSTVTKSRPYLTNTAERKLLNGLLVEDRDHGNVKTGYYYDGLWRLKETLVGNNSVTTTTDRDLKTQYAYTANSSKLFRVTQPSGAVVEYTYEDCGSGLKTLVKTSWKDINSSGVKQTPALTREERFAYNSLGSVTHQWGTGARPVKNVYNAYGQLIEMHTYRSGTGWGGTTLPTGFSSEGDKTVWNFDNLTGVLTSKEDDDGEGVSYIYDWLNRVDQITNARSTIIDYQYYDSTGEFKKKDYSDSTPDVTFTYDRLGRVASVVDVTGLRTFQYNSTTASNPLGLDKEILSQGYYGTSWNLTHKWDTYGRNSGLKMGNSVYPASIFETTRSYQSSTGRWLRDTTSRITGYYTYETATNLIKEILLYDNYDYEDFERKRTYDLTTNYLDSEENTHTANPGISDHSFLRDELGRIRFGEATGDLYSYMNDKDLEFTYNARLELTKVQEFSQGTGAGEIKDRYREFAYDNAGNRTSFAKKSGSSVSYSGNSLNQYTQTANPLEDYHSAITPGSFSGRWFWDNAEKVSVLATRPGAGEYLFVEYDSSESNSSDYSRWMFDFSDTTWYGYNYPANPQVPQYDEDGNLKSEGAMSAGDPTGIALAYEYDAENRLIAIENYAVRIEYQYDYMNRRVRQIVKEDDVWQRETVFVYDGYNLIAEFDDIDPSGDTVWIIDRTYYWGPDVVGSPTAAGGVGALLWMRDHSTQNRYFAGYDGRGNIICMVNSMSGKVISEYEYDPYGELVRESGWVYENSTWNLVGYDPLDMPFRYQTKWHAGAGARINSITSGTAGDDHPYDQVVHDLEVYDFGLRWYRPKLGRFINRDPIGEAGGLNLYAYVGNDPVNLADFIGLNPIITHDPETNNVNLHYNFVPGRGATEDRVNFFLSAYSEYWDNLTSGKYTWSSSYSYDPYGPHIIGENTLLTWGQIPGLPAAFHASINGFSAILKIDPSKSKGSQLFRDVNHEVGHPMLKDLTADENKDNLMYHQQPGGLELEEWQTEEMIQWSNEMNTPWYLKLWNNLKGLFADTMIQDRKVSATETPKWLVVVNVHVVTKEEFLRRVGPSNIGYQFTNAGILDGFTSQKLWELQNPGWANDRALCAAQGRCAGDTYWATVQFMKKWYSENKP